MPTRNNIGSEFVATTTAVFLAAAAAAAVVVATTAAATTTIRSRRRSSSSTKTNENNNDDKTNNSNNVVVTSMDDFRKLENEHKYPLRDFVGYGGSNDDDDNGSSWPNGARLAINFAINVEEGSEPSMVDGDTNNSSSLIECGSDAPPGIRDLSSESMFEYGSRVGIWRVLRAFDSRQIKATAFVCALALERLPELAQTLKRMVGRGQLDVCCHGYRWEDHINMNENEERSKISAAVESITKTLGEPPKGWYCRTSPSIRTRRLLVEHGGFFYDSDSYNDESPYYVNVVKEETTSTTTTTSSKIENVRHLVVPYTLCTNDSKFAPGRAFSTSNDFYEFCKDAIDVLLNEAKEEGVAAARRPKMLSIGLHPRLIGHPSRIGGLHKLLDYAAKNDDVWIARRIDIANAWKTMFPPLPSPPLSPTKTTTLLPPPGSSSSEPRRRLLVTGGGGFVLSHVVDQWLRDDGDHNSSVVVFDLRMPITDEQSRLFFGPLLKTGKLKFFEGDVANQNDWERFEKQHGTSFTHIAAGAAITPTIEDERSMNITKIPGINLFGTLLAFEFARRNGSCSKFLFVSSDAVLSSPPVGGVDYSKEDGTPSVPSYALSKIATEAQLRRYTELLSSSLPFDVVAVRFSDVYGAMDRDTGARNRHNAPYHVANNAINGKPITIEISSTSESFDLCNELGWDYVDAPSVARGIIAILDSKEKPKKFMYDLALGRCVSHHELLTAMLNTTKKKTSSSGIIINDEREEDDDEKEDDDGVLLEKFERRFSSKVRVVVAGKEEEEESQAPVIGTTTTIRTIEPDHWLRTKPLNPRPMLDEFGWEPTPFQDAMQNYVDWLDDGCGNNDNNGIVSGSSVGGEDDDDDDDDATTTTKKESVSATTRSPPPPPRGDDEEGKNPSSSVLSMEGLTMVVTGGASGIGKGIVEMAASRGCNVVSLDTRRAPLEGGDAVELTTDAAAAGEIVALIGDVTNKTDIARAVWVAVSKFGGRLDVFVNNAAIDLTDPPHNRCQKLLETTINEWESVHKINTTGYFLGAQVALEQFLKQTLREKTGLRGKLLNVTSQHGMVACPGNIPYGTSKAAAVYMTKQIAIDYAQSNIACNGVAPGKIVKDRARKVAKYSYDRTPCPRLGTPEDVASAICYLASDETKSFLTGHNLIVDGGWMAY